MFAARSPGFNMGQQSIEPLVYENSLVTASGSVVAHPAGIVSGDLILIIDPYGNGGGARTIRTNSEAGRQWDTMTVNWAALGYVSCVHWKFVNSFDLANTWNCSVSAAFGFSAHSFDAKGAAALALVSSASNASNDQNSLTIPGYTKSAFNRDTLSVFIDRDGDSGAGNPGGFTIRFSAADGSSIFKSALAQNTAYLSGANVTWGGTQGSNGYPEAGFLIEVT